MSINGWFMACDRRYQRAARRKVASLLRPTFYGARGTPPGSRSARSIAAQAGDQTHGILRPYDAARMAIVDEGFWAGRRVLVTGHTGFKGAWLALWLESLGASVAGLSLPAPTSPSLHDLVGAPSPEAVVVTSDKCYAPVEGSDWGHRETDPLGGRDPYSASKAAAELVAAAYRDSFS